jgi:TonB family protein
MRSFLISFGVHAACVAFLTFFQMKAALQNEKYFLTEVELEMPVVLPSRASSEAALRNPGLGLKQFLPFLGQPLMRSEDDIAGGGSTTLTALASLSAKLNYSAEGVPIDRLNTSSSRLQDFIPPAWLAEQSKKIEVKIREGEKLDLARGSAALSEGTPRSVMPLAEALPGLRAGTIANEENQRPETLLKRWQTLRANAGGTALGGSNWDAESRKAFSIGGEIAKRKKVYTPLPDYPAWAEEQGFEGGVTLALMVFNDGTVNAAGIYVLKTSGYTSIDEFAKEALSKWRFEPLADGEKIRAQEGQVRFEFRLGK